MLNEFQARMAAAPEDAGAHSALGAMLLQRGRARDAVPYLRAAVALAPQSAEYRWLLGRALVEVDESTAAADALEQAILLNPRLQDAFHLLAWLYVTQQEYRRARALFEDALAVAPRQVWPRLGLCYVHIAEAGPDEARRSLVKPSAGDTPALAADVALGRALMHFGAYADALECFDAALARDEAESPYVGTLAALAARVEHALGSRERADSRYRAAMVAHPAHDDVLDGYQQFLLRTGRIRDAQGLARQPRPRRDQRPRTLYDGTSLAGKRLMFRHSGGYGDAVLFSQFASHMGRQGATVFLECPEPAAALLAGVPDIAGLWHPHDPKPEWDIECPPLRAPLLCDWDPDDLHAQIPFVTPALERRAFWRNQRAPHALNVGICWRARYGQLSRHDGYTNRTMPAAALRRLLDLPGVAFHNLTVAGDSQDELKDVEGGANVKPSARLIGGFDDTAAAVEALDVVVTVDTSVAHLAGALGTRCLLMLPSFNDWRWGDAASELAWYPSCRAFRQPAPGNWEAVVADVARAVHALQLSTTPHTLRAVPREGTAGPGERSGPSADMTRSPAR